MSSVNVLAQIRDRSEQTRNLRLSRYAELLARSGEANPDELEELHSLIELLRLAPEDVERNHRTLQEFLRHKQALSERSQHVAAAEKARKEFDTFVTERDRIIAEFKDKFVLISKNKDAAERLEYEAGQAEHKMQMIQQAHPQFALK